MLSICMKMMLHSTYQRRCATRAQILNEEDAALKRITSYAEALAFAAQRAQRGQDPGPVPEAPFDAGAMIAAEAAGGSADEAAHSTLEQRAVAAAMRAAQLRAMVAGPPSIPVIAPLTPPPSSLCWCPCVCVCGGGSTHILMSSHRCMLDF